MKYKNTLLKLLHGISSDNAAEIDEACHTFLAITGIVSVEGVERELAAHLTKHAVDLATPSAPEVDEITLAIRALGTAIAPPNR